MINLVGLYLFALIIGGGLLLISVFGGDDGDPSDVDGDLELHGHGAMSEIGDLMLGLFRPRNLTFLLAAFGATGLLLTWVGTSPTLALLLAGSMGAGSWVLSHALFTWLRRTDSAVNVVNDRALEGSIGRVTLPVGPGARGRITLVVAGQQTWITARVEPGVERILPVGTEVLIRRTEGGVAEVIPTDILELPPRHDEAVMDISTFAILAAVILGIITAMSWVVRSLIVICLPNEMVVVTGRKRRTSDGQEVGYRVLHGGRTMRIPLIEKVSRLDLTTIPIEVGVQNAYSKGGIPLFVQGIANVKISGREPISDNAVERLLNKPFEEVMQIAKDTLEGNLRGVLATLTPEEVNEDRLKFANFLIEEADEDLKKLGLELDTLKIQNVTDEVKYLDSIGRQKTAEILKLARVAEATRSSESEQAEAGARQAAQVASLQADLRITEESNRLRVRKAELEAEALAREAEAQVAGEKARVVAEQALQQERIGLEQRRLEADVMLPAKADRDAAEQRAKGVAATIAEDGRARLMVLEQTIKLYQSAGSEAERIFILNMLPEIIRDISGTVGKMSIDKVTVIDSGNGATGVGKAAGQLPSAIIQITEQIEAATGVNILSRLQQTKPVEVPPA